MDKSKESRLKQIDYLKRKYPPKEGFVKRIKDLIGEEDAKKFFELCYTETPDIIRCNTLKIKPDVLKKRLERYGWLIKQPMQGFPEVMIIKNNRAGELGKSKEHLLGYFYVQEISSMLPMFILQPKVGDFVLDLCASPGSKTTQAAALMNNEGLILANEVNIGRVGILLNNLERCGVSNVIVSKKEGVKLCETLLNKSNFRFDKILVDAPCSGEGTLRKSPETFTMWNKKMIQKIASIQKKLAESAIKLLKVGGEMIYSTCTLAPEENEFIVEHLLNHFDIEIENINLPLKFRSGVCFWEGKELNKNLKKCLRLYPQDNDSDGFFVAKIKKLSEEIKR